MLILWLCAAGKASANDAFCATKKIRFLCTFPRVKKEFLKQRKPQYGGMKGLLSLSEKKPSVYDTLKLYLGISGRGYTTTRQSICIHYPAVLHGGGQR